MAQFEELLELPRRALRELMATGHPIEPEALADYEYRGTSLGLPAAVERLTWKTFQKVFCRVPGTGVLRGWNVRVEQRGLRMPSQPRLRHGQPHTFGHFAVVPLDRVMPLRCGPGLLLDYGQGGNGLFDPLRWVRDPLVALTQGSADLLLGWTYLQLGPLRLPTPSYFVLERERALTHRALPPRARRIAL
jgi:hypothetical protein